MSFLSWTNVTTGAATFAFLWPGEEERFDHGRHPTLTPAGPLIASPAATKTGPTPAAPTPVFTIG
jgi:hypothetical protein